MKLKDIAHSRTGDKGDISNISLIPYKKEDYEMLKEKVTPEVVKHILVKSAKVKLFAMILTASAL